MVKINLRKYYSDFYTADCIIEVPDEVAALMDSDEHAEAAYYLRRYRHKAYYSLDRGDGIERDILFVSLSPCEIYERKVTVEQLHAAIAALPDKQAKRIYAQLSSYELQHTHYSQLVGNHPNWDLKRIYADEGISGTSLKNRDEFNEMIAACRAGEYDLIVTKSVSRFARNLVDCISLIRELKRLTPPVGVYFETDNLNTLSEDSELMLSFLATFAQEESVKKARVCYGPCVSEIKAESC